jgi:cytochrome b561
VVERMSEEQIYEQARKRVEARRAFFVHLMVYVVVNATLVLVWAFAAGRGHPWFIYPMGGWGIGLLFHGLGTFVTLQNSDSAAIEKEAAKIRGR